MSIEQSHHFSRRDVLKLGAGLSPLLLSPELIGMNLFAGNYTPIEKRTIPVSGETIPVVGLGTWRTFDAGNSKQRRAPLLEVIKTLVQKRGFGD